jgi:hypothetical protein
VTAGLGRMQLRLLEPMGRHPLGGWPRKWVLNYRDNQIMLGLARRELVKEQPENPSISWVLTPAGRAALDSLPKPSYPIIDRRKRNHFTR